MAQTSNTPELGKDTAIAAALSIDRLILHVPPMSEADARQLARQVGEALREWPTAPTASGRISRIDTQIGTPQAASAGPAMGPGGSLGGAGGSAAPGALARQIAESVLAAALREVR